MQDKSGITPAARQDEVERAVFAEFAAVSSLAIDSSAVLKVPPPAPDIRCRLADGNYAAFELVEVVDQSLAQHVGAQIALQVHYEDTYDALSGSVRTKLDRTLANSMVVLWFSEGTTLRQRQSVAAPLMQVLLAVDEQSTGDVEIGELSPAVSKIVPRVSLLRGKFAGPCFDVPSVTSFGDCLVQAVRGKFAKHYESPCATYLLAYYGLQPEPLPGTLVKLEGVVSDELKSSPFSAVWVFNRSTGSALCFS